VAQVPAITCFIDVDNLLCMLDGFTDFSLCPLADIFPCTASSCAVDEDCDSSVTGPLCMNGGCRCVSDVDCAALGVSCNELRDGGRCELVDVDDLLAELDAFSGNPACPPKCPPGACIGDFPFDGMGLTCLDGDPSGPFFGPNGMSESDCFYFTNGSGTYCGDFTVCTGIDPPTCSAGP